MAEAPDTTASDEALLAKLEPKIHSLINSALSSHNKQADKKRSEDREALKVDFANLLEEKFSAFKPAEDQDGGKGGKEGKGKGDNVELQTLRKEMGDLKQRAEKAEQERAAERSKNRSMSLKTEAVDELAKVGITTHARIALSVLLQEGRIAYDTDLGEGDEDKLLFRSDEGGGWVDLGVGLKGWAKSQDARIFLPPTGAAGAGTRPTARTTEAGAKLTPEQQRHALGDALKNALT